MLKIAQVSDLHYSEKNLAESDKCLGFAVDQAISRGAQIAVVSGDSTDHALDVHSPAVEKLALQIRRLADHCPVLMLQGTFSHEPPGTLSIFPLLSSRHPVHIVERICQVALLQSGRWLESEGWRFEAIPQGAVALFTCIPTVNKAVVAATVGAAEAGEALGKELGALLQGYGPINSAARAALVPTIGVSHGTVSGCVTEHGVPMAGFDHEFTTSGLFSAMTQAFMLGHIHRHQAWEEDGRVVAYAGSIGRFHYGEEGDKGFLMWHVGAATARCELVATPARRTVDLVFAGKPDLAEIERAASTQDLDGAFVRVRWSVADEDRHGVDREAIKRALQGAAGVQLEGRVIPVVRSRAAGISRCANLHEKVCAWAAVTGVEASAVLGCLEQLAEMTPDEIAQSLLQERDEDGLAPADSIETMEVLAEQGIAEPSLF
ncbi:metallophosphatase family protein [Piscinibacter gummiphilus]|uniref:Metallophosphatase family protein n=1 Tax=Piscinibacter gummiphilus TaxID=946333 RepID=A0ABZ0D1V6_9BURK|nr:metallophosphatase family protein [Piscinibacter gummiphilus]WOB11230.1 metallophosphatase family protein [Piscinibacter gummiphilus]